jgi:hypothetical protein
MTENDILRRINREYANFLDFAYKTNPEYFCQLRKDYNEAMYGKKNKDEKYTQLELDLLQHDKK